MLAAASEVLPDGRRLRVARLGSGPPLVLLHGYPDNLQIWCELAPRLAGKFQVIAVDWPGMGESEAWPGGATPAHMARRLLTLLDLWGLKDVHLAGMDMGGQPVLAFAALWPERLRSVVVMNSLLFGEEETSWEIRVLRQFGWNRLLLRRFPWLVFRRAEWTFLPRGTRLARDLRKDLWGTFRRPAVREFIVKMCAGYQGTLAALPELYRKIQCPVLALWGGRDRHFPPRHAERLLETVRGCRLHVVPEGEHWMAWYRAEEVANAVRSFAGGR
jgi:pimeloyl-ACP methyl ester carboxylesterase